MAKEVQTVSVVVTNTSRSPRGVNAADGKTVMLEPGKSSPQIDVTTGELASLRMGTEFSVNEIGPGQPVIRRAPEPVRVTGTDAALRQQIAAKDAEIAGLTRQLEEARKALEEKDAIIAAKDADTPPPLLHLHATHRGRGSYSIVDPEGKELIEGLDKAAAEAFNALDDAGKAAFVAEHKNAA